MANMECRHCAHCKKHSIYLKSYYCNLRGDDRHVQDNESVNIYDCACTKFEARGAESKNVYVVTYVGLSDSEYDANGYSECHVYGDRTAALAKLKALRDAEIENCKAEGRDYEVLKDEDDECRISWCGDGEQVRLEIHEEEVK